MRRGAGGGQPRWNPTSFAGGDQVLVAFRVLGSRKHEHWLNKAAVAITSSPWSKHGRLCHVELMMQLDAGQWYRFGVVKKTYAGEGPDGKPLFEWGRVHAKPVDTGSWDSKYVFLSLYVPRARQKIAFDFLMSQENHDFHYWAYVLNTLLPGGLGAGEYHPRMHVEDHKWFCSQLVGCALQAMADDEAVAATAAPVTAARNAMRAAGQLLVLLAAVTAGLVTGLALKGAGAASSSVSALAGTSVGAVTLLVLSALMGFVVAAMSPRRQVYARRGAPNDWRGVVCRQTALHKSSPNSLYDTLYGNRGVYPSRDPHGKALSLGGGV